MSDIGTSILVCVWMAMTAVVAVYSPEGETEIRAMTVLNASYDASSRPAAQTSVAVSLAVLAIDQLENDIPEAAFQTRLLDIKVQKFTMAGWLTFEWRDQRLVWDKTSMYDIEFIFAKPKTIWRPEVVMDNSLDDLGVIHDDELMLRVKYDGTVDWEPLILFNTHCYVDITFYPYDQQKCAVEIVSWAYNYKELKLEHLLEFINLEDYVENGEWTIVKTLIEDKNLTEHTTHGVVIYPQLDFWFYLDRRTDYYNLNVMMPVFLTSLLIMLVFLVPVQSGEKLQYVLTVQLSLAVLLTLVTESLPSTSVTTSILGVYLGVVLILAAIATLLSVLILMLYFRDGDPNLNTLAARVAWFSAKVTCVTLGTPQTSSITFVEPFDAKGDVEDEDEKGGGNEKEKQQPPVEYDVTWQDIAEVINRLCFFVFMGITVVMNVSFVTALGVGGLKTTPSED